MESGKASTLTVRSSSWFSLKLVYSPLVLKPDHNDVFSTGFTVLSATEVPFTWLYLFVTTDQFVGHLVNHTTGAGYPAVRPDDFERAAIALPPTTLLNLFHESTDSNFRLVSKLEQQNQKLSLARDLLLPRNHWHLMSTIYSRQALRGFGRAHDRRTCQEKW